jgi:hypothetical protein
MHTHAHRNQTVRSLFLAFKIMLAFLWPIAAAATSMTLAQTVKAIPPAAWLIVAVFSTVSGCVALLNWAKLEAQRIDKMTLEMLALRVRGTAASLGRAGRLEEAVHAEWALFYRRLPLVVLANILGSLLAGSIMFFCSSMLPDFMTMPAIGAAAWLGAKFLDMAAEKVIAKKV